MEDVKELRCESKGVFGKLGNRSHEQVIFCHDRSIGLRAIIAIHDTTLGPALGGTRFWNYASDADALEDVLRLSEGMTYKSALAGLNIGGGKSVIIGDPSKIKNEILMRRFGQFVHTLKGRYICAKDVNIHNSDILQIHTETPYALGLPKAMGGAGDVSKATSHGVFVAIKAMCKKIFGNESLAGKRCFLQGAGSVGMYIIQELSQEGAHIYVHDINAAHCKKAQTFAHVTIVDESGMYDTEADFYIPCPNTCLLYTSDAADE